MSGRFEQLDSLRGIAAFTVVINHHLNVLPSIYDRTAYQSDQWLIGAIKYSPLHTLWGGHEAVVFFFVISGFVLSLPYFKRKMEYTPFLLKRISRIYLPYAVAVCSAIVLSVMFSRGGIAALSSWFNGTWTSPITFKVALNHFLLIGAFNNGELDPVLWSLVHEMRISILFPAVLYIVTRFQWKTALAVAGSCSGLSFILSGVCYRFASYNPDFFLTIHYVSMFIIGGLLAKRRDSLARRFNALSRASKFSLLAGGLLAYSYRWWFFHDTRLLHIEMIDDWAIAAGVSVFIIFALSSRKASSALMTKPLLFCGKISYSLYLYHSIVLLAMINILFGIIPLWQILLLSLAITMMVSTAMYHLVEVPSIKLGRRASSKDGKQVKALPLTDNLQPEQASA